MTSNQNLKDFSCSAKDTIKVIKMQAKDCENIFAKDTFDKEVLDKIYK